MLVPATRRVLRKRPRAWPSSRLCLWILPPHAVRPSVCWRSVFANRAEGTRQAAAGPRSTAAEGASLANGARHGCSDIRRAVVAARINAARGPSRCREEAWRGRTDARVGSKGRAAGSERRGGTGQRRQVNRKHAAPASLRRVAALRGALHARWGGAGRDKGTDSSRLLGAVPRQARSGRGSACGDRRGGQSGALQGRTLAGREGARVERDLGRGEHDKRRATVRDRLAPRVRRVALVGEAASGAAEVKKLAAEAVLAGADTEAREKAAGDLFKTTMGGSRSTNTGWGKRNNGQCLASDMMWLCNSNGDGQAGTRWFLTGADNAPCTPAGNWRNWASTKHRHLTEPMNGKR
ncbi:hypothetical protein ERJ75_000686600 [Trypanosoma vivax]|nr:hypothetical protein ERJ75_000686600 [Trypanosoma vivax]